MSVPSFRVYFVTHHDGRVTGIMMRSHRELFDGPPQSAYGDSEEDVLRQLEVQLTTAELEGEDQRSKYYWTEHFQIGSCRVVVHPETAVGDRRVIGRREIPLRLSYAWAETDRGGYRVMLPRFGWGLVLEDLELAPAVLQSAVAGALVGEEPSWLYDFRREGPERVFEWTPDWTHRVDDEDEVDDPFDGLPAVREVADELLDKVRRRQLPPAVGQHEDLLPLEERVLASRPTPLLVVGGSGVGKTTWVQRLARFLLLRKRQGATVPRIYATSRDRMVAGQIYLGMWQARALAIVEELAHEGQYLYVDRLSDLVRPMSDGGSLADIFAEALRNQEISLIAEATPTEFEMLRRQHRSLLGAFHVVRLDEPEPRRVPQLLLRYLEKNGAAERVRPEGLVRLVRHLADFVPGQCFPGKAFRAVSWLLQEAGKEGTALGAQEVSAFFSKYSGLPVELVADEHALGPAAIAARLSERVVGQAEACAAAGRVIARLKAGLQDPDRPIGSLFFVGPTGVGKTELAKQMARFMFGSGADHGAERLIRLDMSEYMLPGSALRLLDAEGSGSTSLAQKVRQQPLSVVLFDEIEKAHPEVFDLLLALLGEGRMTDSRGRLVDFRTVVFVMTSNLGVSERAPVGFGDGVDDSYLRHVRDHFRPEFFARIDRIVSFRRLDLGDVEQVVDLLMKEVQARTGFRQRGLRLRVTASARRRLAQLGYHPSRGARPLKRVVEERVVTPLAVRLAEDPSLQEVEVWVRVAEDPDERAPGTAIRLQLD